ncbi:hypothetical protein L1076_08775 [Vibrio sp. MMG022]|uniref:hypothetical protein n=1 Tax=Vibrio sp. MMG023 TaxID=2909979 RepID=UPI001F37C0CC|nr:hypothetical protein [Vibrio sp. MMG023]MCF6451684.1 hypothetical protein [Vibrio sp. MMG023]
MREDINAIALSVQNQLKEITEGKIEKMPYHSGKAEIANTEAGYFAPLILLTQQLGGWSVLFM